MYQPTTTPSKGEMMDNPKHLYPLVLWTILFCLIIAIIAAFKFHLDDRRLAALERRPVVYEHVKICGHDTAVLYVSDSQKIHDVRCIKFGRRFYFPENLNRSK
jgi:hypothetical protein